MISARRSLCCLLVGFAALAPVACQSATNGKRSPATMVRLSTTTSTALPQRYVGLAVEGEGICRLLQIDRSRRTEFEQLFRNLGPGILHVGGRSSDLSKWAPLGTPSCTYNHVVFTAGEARALFQFAGRIGWRVVWELPMAHFNVLSAAREAGAVAHDGGRVLDGFSIGNEPDLYSKSGFRPRTWSYAQTLTQWRLIRAAVRLRVPSAAFLGPDSCCNTSFFSSFAIEARHDVAGLSFHFYAGEPGRKAAAAYLMSPTPMRLFETREQEYWGGSARADGLPLDLTETNTFPGGGYAGVSNAFASTLWISDLLFKGAQLHLGEADVQESAGGDPYSPIDVSGRPRPIYYGMLFYANATQGASRFIQTSASAAGLSSYGLEVRPSQERVIIVNKSAAGRHVQVTSALGIRSAGQYRLTAPGLLATSNVRIGGRTISGDGTLSPDFSHVSVKQGSVWLWVPRYSAVACQLLTQRRL